MKLSQSLSQTSKTVAHDADSVNAKLLTQAGFIKKEAAGVYSYLPFGKRVLSKIEQIIREEMNAVGGQEVLMPALTPLENWKQTGRADVDIAFKPTEKTVLGWSHEEIITPLAKQRIKSYRDLPFAAYQIQTKFRNEPRAKSGLLRGREFQMKDLYSFHASREDLEQYYDQVKEAYFKVFERCGLESFLAAAGGGEFTQNISHEFQVLTEAGEDKIRVCEKCKLAWNEELVPHQSKNSSSSKNADSADSSQQNQDQEHGIGAGRDIAKCEQCGGELKEERGSEVGNIFDLDTKYSDAFDLVFTNEEGKQQKVLMGCYGIGVSRLVATIAEIHHDEAGLIWPESVAPFQIHLIALGKDDAAKEEAEKIYQELSQKTDVLFDDRDCAAGAKFADADLIGIPLRVVVSPKTLEAGGVEIKKRSSEEQKIIKADEILKK